LSVLADLKVWVPPSWANELRHDPAIEAVVRDVANNIANKAGDGYEVEAGSSKSRVKYTVKAATPKAYRDNLKNNTLLKAMG